MLLKDLGPVCAVIGAQWGDEGKGKAIDILSEHFDVIARASGGANAGHTIVVGGKKHVFHLLPAGSLHPGKPVILGSGMVIHLPTLLEEIALLEDAGISITDRITVSGGAHIVFRFHKEIDGVLEEKRAEALGSGIGTTKRGIGPAYTDKAARIGMRMEQLVHWNEEATRKELLWKSKFIDRAFGVRVDVNAELADLEAAAKKLRGRIAPMRVTLDLLREKKRILIEGAQATLLDIDHGTYPYVTSSSTTAAGALQGLGLPPRCLTSVIGVAKAYCTRVGDGPFPSEADKTTGDRLRERGGEYGATTGRPRRCGWISIPDINFSVEVNGFSCLNLTKLDVLDEEPVIKIAFGAVSSVRFEELPGWQTSTAGLTAFEKLPAKAQAFISFIEKNTGIPVRMIGTGPKREDMIIR